MSGTPRLLQEKTTYTFDYPEAVEAAKTQRSIFWLPDEIEVEKDIQDMKVNMTEPESHGVITTLKLFTLYELLAGNEYWGERISKSFPRPDIQQMANCFSFFELNVHAPFYNKLNEVLGLNTDEFYNSYTQDEVLMDRMDFIDQSVNDPDLLLSIGTFSLVEGAVLYSNFAFLKHFQSQGKNLLNNVVAGINFSVRDENLHSEGGAWLYKQLKSEGYHTPADVKKTEKKIIANAKKIYEHECKIVDMIFEKGSIVGITDVQIKNFVQSRLNLCLKGLDIDPIFEVKYNPIASWFYKGINSVQFHDFFSRTGSDYNRDWTEAAFKW